MNDDFASIDVGDTFFHMGSKYRKMDDNRAILLSDPEIAGLQKGKAYFFYQEDEAERISKRSSPQVSANGSASTEDGHL
ncbi:hypothetical protein [Novipirellula rosea]|uniref:Uncharacterized protein n=1 Tax=Novipirellula rosea TaxID=1031540 RepID=A0ABP8N5D9_9BACT|tara:strand:+ start:1303 stop:1539 length:237 start_codon:yes stop_codon:yes gene_type:complete